MTPAAGGGQGLPWCGSSTASASTINWDWLMPWIGTAPLFLPTSSIAGSSPGQGETSHADLKGKAPTLVVGPMKTPNSTTRTNDDLFTERVTEALLKSIFLLVLREALKKSKNRPPRLIMRGIEGILMHADYSDEMLEQLLFALEDLKLLLAYKGSDLLVSFGSAEVILKLVNQVPPTYLPKKRRISIFHMFLFHGEAPSLCSGEFLFMMLRTLRIYLHRIVTSRSCNYQ